MIRSRFHSTHVAHIRLRITDHAEKLHEVPDEYLAESLPIAKKIALALGSENYNVLQVRPHKMHRLIYSFIPTTSVDLCCRITASSRTKKYRTFTSTLFRNQVHPMTRV